MRRLHFFFFAAFGMLQILQTNSSWATSEVLWATEMGAGWNVNSGVDSTAIPNSAKLYNLGFEIPKNNPDRLIVKLRMDDSFDKTPLDSSKKRNLGFWIFASTRNCPNEMNCNLLIGVNGPTFDGSSFPTAPSTQNVTPQIYSGGYSGATTSSNCPAPWWIESSNKRRGEIDFQLSITCLGIPKEFLAYAFSEVETGLDPNPFNFTQPNFVNNPFFPLAEAAYNNSGGARGLLGPGADSQFDSESPSINFTYYVKGSNPIKKNKSTTILVDGYCANSGKLLDIQAKYKTSTFVTLTKNIKCINQGFSAKVTIWGGSTIRVFERATKLYSDDLLVGIGERLERTN